MSLVVRLINILHGLATTATTATSPSLKEHRSLYSDLSFGLTGQPLVAKSLVQYFDEGTTETKDKFSQYDAFSVTTLYEVKCRRCSYSQYSTTTIPPHKKT